jgi:hypothetical protein
MLFSLKFTINIICILLLLNSSKFYADQPISLFQNRKVFNFIAELKLKLNANKKPYCVFECLLIKILDLYPTEPVNLNIEIKIIKGITNLIYSILHITLLVLTSFLNLLDLSLYTLLGGFYFKYSLKPLFISATNKNEFVQNLSYTIMLLVWLISILFSIVFTLYVSRTKYIKQPAYHPVY